MFLRTGLRERTWPVRGGVAGSGIKGVRSRSSTIWLREGCTRYSIARVSVYSYDERPSHPYNAGTEHVAFLTDQADIASTKRKALRGDRRLA